MVHSEFYKELIAAQENQSAGTQIKAGEFEMSSENLLTVIKELAIAWILCGRLHA